MLARLVSWRNLLVDSIKETVLTMPVWMPVLYFISVLSILHRWTVFLRRMVLQSMPWQFEIRFKPILQQSLRLHLQVLRTVLQFSMLKM